MKAAAERDRKVGVEGNINLLAVLRDAGVRRYLLQSSGRSHGLEYREGPVMAGSGIAYKERGEHVLGGLPGG